MKLLITTQTVDRNDPVLGFFHGWVLEFSKYFERIDIICLREGDHDLPENVRVFSLGKEEGKSLLSYVIRFYRYAWRLNSECDAVFSHMNPHYIILAGILWKVTGKRIFFWRNHAEMNLMTRIAAYFSERVFYTSPFACTARFSHAVQMPVGIDTDVFKADDTVERRENLVLFLGRLSPVKQPELFVEAVRTLPAYEAHLYGDEPDDAIGYHAQLEARAGANTIFHTAVVNTETPKIYSACGIYVNLTPKGSMDKTIFEAAACGALVLAQNDSVRTILPKEMFLQEATPDAVRKGIEQLHNLLPERKRAYRDELRRMVVSDHSLEKLGALLYQYIAKGESNSTYS